MKLTLGFSPCPNDTFIFDALVHHKVDTEGLDFEYLMADVEELNSLAFRRKLDITKVSFHAYLYLTSHYILLDSGSALGFGTGPLVIAREHTNLGDLKDKKIAIPGKYTTANLLFSLAVNDPLDKVEMVFSEIEQAILDGKVDAGVIIHENRFTYQDKGLIEVADLGDFWEKLTGKPIPLGGIVANRRLPGEIIHRFNRSLQRSVEFALTQTQLSDFVRCNAQEMSVEVMRKHINLYVNKFSLNLGKAGKDAVLTLFQKALDHGIIDSIPDNLFMES
jgi:1,4-dihydroxy-6-naphthoate synthase